MKKLIPLILFALIFSCSKKQQESAPIPKVNEPDTSTSLISEETIKKARLSYERASKGFLESNELKLSQRLELYESLEKEALIYLGILAQVENSQTTIEKIKQELIPLKQLQTQLKENLEKFRLSYDNLFNKIKVLKSLKEQTDNFSLSKITENNLRDDLLTSTQEILQEAKFLKLSFPKELSETDLIKIDSQEQIATELENLFAPYITYREVLGESEINLTNLGFSFTETDNTKPALIHEKNFFKTLEEHIKSIDTFAKDASIYLSEADLKNLNGQKSKLETTLQELSEVRTFQKEIGNDLFKIRLMGYDFPENIGSLKEEELNWKTKEIYVYETMPTKGIWQIGYHIVGPRSDARQEDHITLERYYYQLVTPATYPAFDDVFGTAFTRIILYLGKYDKIMPKDKEAYYMNINALLIKTYTIVTDYIDSLQSN